MERIVSENLGKIINSKNFTQSELAKKTNVSRATINKHLSISKKTNPTLSTLFKLALVLDIEFPQLFSKEPDVEKTFNQAMTLDRYMNIFVQNLKYKLRGKKQNLVSYELGIQESTVSEILNENITNPKLSTVSIISDQLDTSLELMFKRGGDMK